MEPSLVEREAFLIMGVPARIRPADADFKDIWMNRFMAKHEQILPLSADRAYYGAYFCAGEEGYVDMIAGMAVRPGSPLIEGWAMREVPGGLFAQFCCTVGTIGQTYGRIYTEWLPGSAYEYDATRTDYEFYPPDTADDNSPVAIYIPVRKRPE